MPNRPKTHDDCRKTVCVICMKKCDRELSDAAKEKVLHFIQKGLNFLDERVSLGICVDCYFK